MIMPAPVQAAMAAALSDDAHAAVQRERYAARRSVLREAFTAAGWTVDHSEAGLYLWLTHSSYDCWSAAELLAADCGIPVTPGSGYGAAGAGHVRVALTPTGERAAGEQIRQEFPELAEPARVQRAFLVRAVRFLAGPAGIRQFLDIGAGLPAGGNTHEIAQRIAPDTGIVYTDNDPAVLVHARALLQTPLLASTPEGRVSYVDPHLRDLTPVPTAPPPTPHLH